MKNIPKKIYLILGDLTEEEFEELDFNKLVEVTWCEDKQNEFDIEYTLEKYKKKEVKK